MALNRQISSSNPAARNGVFTRVHAQAGEGVMTLGGTLLKAGILVLLTAAAAVYTWTAAPVEQIPFLVGVGAIGGFVVALLTIFVPRLAPVTSPFYAVLEGLALGGISAMYNQIPKYQGLPVQAVALTFGVALVMLALYTSGAVRATPRFRRVLTIAAFGILAVYLTNWIMGLFGASGFGFVSEASPMGIGFSVVAAGVAAFFLILDFDLIEEGVRNGAPKRMEWYGGFTLLMTLVWLYLELLRLLDKLRR